MDKPESTNGIRAPEEQPLSHRGHRQRMAARFAEEGFDGWRAHEILERLLYEVLPRRNTNETAHALVERFGSLRGVFLADPRELVKTPGIGPVSAKWIAQILPHVTEILLRDLGSAPCDENTLLVLAHWYLDYLARPAVFVALSADGVLASVTPAGETRQPSGPDPEPDAKTVLLTRESAASPALLFALRGHLTPAPEKIFVYTAKREMRELRGVNEELRMQNAE